MNNVSNEFRRQLSTDNRNYQLYVKIVLSDGRELHIENKDIWENGFKIEDAVSGDSCFDIGAAIINKFSLTLNNIDENFSKYNFNGAVVTALVGLSFHGKTEKIQKGIYTVDETSYDGAVIKLECLDNLCKFEKSYRTSTLQYPATIGEIVRDACECCGTPLLSTVFDGSTETVRERPDDEALTFLQVISWCAQRCCKFARCDEYGRLVIGWYNTEAFADMGLIDGGRFDKGAVLPELFPYLNTTTGMSCLRDNVKQDDGTDTIEGVSWFKFNGKTCETLYVSGNHWIGLSSSAEELKVCRRDGAMYYLYRQDGAVSGRRFLKIRWEGYTAYNKTEEQYALKFEIFLLEPGILYLNVLQTPTNKSYLRTSSLVCGDSTINLSVADGTGSGSGIILVSDSDGRNWEKAEPGKLPVTYFTGDFADGGDFNHYDSGHTHDAGVFENMETFHHIFAVSSLNISTDNVAVTGIKVTAGENEQEKSFLYGSEGYVLSVSENKLIHADEVMSVAEFIGSRAVGLCFRPFSCSCLSDPTMEAGDLCFITDGKQNSYKSFITRHIFQPGGYQSVQCSAETPSRNQADSYSDMTKAIVEAKKNTQNQISNYNIAVQMLTSLMTQAFGVYKTEEVQDDGSIIYYMHNKPTLEESQTIWKMTANAFAVSTDGGKNWNAGMDSSGNAVVNVLSAIGITADWIRAGEMSADRIKGGTLTLGGSGNQGGVLKVQDASGSQVGIWDKDGINVKKGTFSGSLDAATGTFRGALNAATGTFKGSLSAATGTFSGMLSAATGTFTGKIMSDNGWHWVQIDNGYMQGGESNRDFTGYVAFNTIAASTGTYGTRIAGKGILALLSRDIGVASYASINSDVTVTTGESGSIFVATDLEIEALDDGGVSWSYTNRTLTFEKGLMVTAI